MKRKLLPVFLSFALLANGSLTAFATDSSIDTVTESDAQTTVSEDQGNPEETTRKKFLKTKQFHLMNLMLSQISKLHIKHILLVQM